MTAHIVDKAHGKQIFTIKFKTVRLNLPTSNQSGYRPGNSCVHQLISLNQLFKGAFNSI